MNEEELAAIKARADAASPGPWGVDLYDGGDDYRWIETGGPEGTGIGTMSDLVPNQPQARANAAFVAHAREDIPSLITEVERLRAENANLRSALEAVKEFDQAWAAVQQFTATIAEEQADIRADAERIGQNIRNGARPPGRRFKL